MTYPNPERETIMSNVKCGHCKRYHLNVELVRTCAARHHKGTEHTSRVQTFANSRVNPAQALADIQATMKPEWNLRTPRPMVESMREGRYAVEVTLPNQPRDWIFLRVSRPKSGKKAGCLIVQTQHSDFYKPYFTIYPNGQVYFYQNAPRLDMALLMVAADPFTSAINYGRELGCCSRCARELTDERSRYYSIGPECEKYWPEIINYINETRGVFVP